ncbi:tetratricopeptide repeat protein [Streptomyces sp. NPDC006610]|uniref:tetratricopeptide repeat protein n=1 Tax=Streptomyces sp. NPDC006610 TaxID=3154584 RepID=UPI0033A6E746
MSEISDFEELRRAMAENAEQPEGPARNARAEVLLAQAERLNIPLAVIEALGHQLKVYNYSSEKDKMFVPFARLLRMWDERPEDFDAYEAHSLHWVFKWMSSGMLGQPHIPLAAIEKWLGEMEHRYRLAGYSQRAVRSAEFSVAAHVGDLPRAERAYAAWLAADRDAMADCHACELNGQGWWQAVSGRDAEALELWGPVLEGEFTCAHEPHSVLSSSLKSLLRLGRVDEARAHHLRGLRLVRPMESMRGAYADHVEFCALTGNEARGLELLAERPAYFTDDGHPQTRLDFLSVVALLMDRLTARGLGGRQVPGPTGRSWTARELGAYARTEALALAARFDARNGTSYVSERARARMDQEALVERLPLGVRSARPGSTAHASPAAVSAPAPDAAPAPDGGSGLSALLAEARRLSETLRPNAVEAWAAVARAAEGVALDARDRAEIADHEAMSLGPAGAELFDRAARLYAEAGDPGEALAARARAAYVRALGGDVDAAVAAVAEAYDEVLALFAESGTGVRQTASVLIGRARVLMRRVIEPDDSSGGPAGGGAPRDTVLAEAEAAAREVLALVDGHTGDDVRLASRAAEARAMLAELAVHHGDLRSAAGLFAQAAAAYVDAGLPWFAVEYEARLAGLAHHLGDTEEAERALRAALEHGGAQLEPVGRAQLHLQLAELLGGRELPAEAAEHALEASHWADEAGESPTVGAWARHLLGGFLLRQGRWAEAAEVLESALLDLTAETHGDGAIVQTQWWLGDCLSELGEHRAAAERRLEAAETARHWPEQQDHATLAHLAAESLGRAGLRDEADRAYARAGELWRSVGNVHGLVRSLRARAWLALSTQDTEDGESAEDGREVGRELMEAAVAACESALRTAADEESRFRLTEELGHTHRQFGDLLARSSAEDAEDGSIQAAFEEALAEMEEAVALFASLGYEALHSRTGAELAAGWLEADLGRTARAESRARAVLAAYANASPDDETTRARQAEAEQMLRVVREQEDE